MKRRGWKSFSINTFQWMLVRRVVNSLKNGKLTTSRLFVRSILAVTFAVAQFHLCDALGLPVDTSLRTQELVVGAGNRGAVSLVTLVRTVLETVAVELAGNAHLIRAPELTRVTRREVWRGVRLGY